MFHVCHVYNVYAMFISLFYQFLSCSDAIRLQCILYTLENGEQTNTHTFVKYTMFDGSFLGGEYLALSSASSAGERKKI